MRIYSFLTILLLVLCSCTSRHYTSRVTSPLNPENVLDLTSEQVAFSSSAPNIIADISGWIRDDVPNRAELMCSGSKCNEVANLLNKKHIPFTYKEMDGAISDIILYYDSLEARDCDGQLSNSNNFGCAMSMNMMNMIKDYRNIIETDSLTPIQANIEANRSK